MLLTFQTKKRLLDDVISDSLNKFGLVSLYGPVGCGTTTSGFSHLSGVQTPRFIDDWDEFPEVMESVLHTCSSTWKNSLFLATSSSLPDIPSSDITKSRASYIRMSSLSLFETGDSTGLVSLRKLFDGEIPRISSPSPDIHALYSLCVRGGWPAVLETSEDEQRQYSVRYLNKTADRLDETKGRQKRDKILNLIRIMACQESSVSSVSEYISLINSSYPDLSLSRNTILNYLEQLDKLMLTWNQDAFVPSADVSRIVLKSPKCRFADCSLVVAAMDMTSDMLSSRADAFAHIFDCLCVHDLRVYADVLGARLFHYRDNYGVSADAVVQLDDGRWGAFKNVLDSSQTDSAAADLLRLQGAYASTSAPPSFLCILCGLADEAYTRPDGVMIVPITSLKP